MAESAASWSQRVRKTVETLCHPLVADGATVVLTRLDAETREVSVSYSPGRCESCVMSPSDLARLLEEGIQQAVRSVSRVVVETHRVGE